MKTCLCLIARTCY